MVRGKHVKRREFVINTKSLALMVSLIVMLGLAVGVTLAWLMDSTESITNTFSPSNIKITLNETAKEFKMVPGHTIDKDPIVTLHKGSEPCYLFIEVTEKDAYSLALDGVGTTYKFSDLIAYSINSSWMQLVDDSNVKVPGVYYQKVNKYTAEDDNYSILTSSSYTFNEATYSWSENQVLTKPDVTKEILSAITREDSSDSSSSDSSSSDSSSSDSSSSDSSSSDSSSSDSSSSDSSSSDSSSSDSSSSPYPTLTFKAYAFQLYKNSEDEFEPYEAWKQIKGYTS